MNIALIGLGRMGQAMAARLIAAGHELLLYNRSAGKAAELVARGGREAASISDAARYSGVVLSMVADDAALDAVCTGPGGLLASLPPGGIHVAMGTHDISHVRNLAAAHAKAGQTLLCAPVLGRPDAVTAGRLAIIVGGSPAAIARCQTLFETLGRRVFHAGPDPGAAAAMKLGNNFLLACAIEALGEAFALAQKCGVRRSAFHEMVIEGLFACPAYATYAKIIAEQAWDQVGFSATLGLKDLNLTLAAANAVAVPLPSASICRDRLLGAIAHGDAERDWSAMALEQARASGLG